MQEHRFRCKSCKRILIKRSQGQQYCGSGPCQKARNNAWRREKYEVDPDYRANQRASTKAWLASQGGSAAYYRGYRKRRKEQQREKRQRKPQRKEPAAETGQATGQTPSAAAAESANSNAKTPQSPVKSGRYRLSPWQSANSNAVLVELTVIPDT